LNAYSHANDNPITKSDPIGLSSSFTDMGFFNSSYPGLPTSVAQQIQQAKYNALKIAVGLPAATMMGAGALASAVIAPEISTVGAAAYQGALGDVALRATNNIRTGQQSSALQYGGSALFGAATGYFTAGAGLATTIGVGTLSSAAENTLVDRSLQPRAVGANALGSGAGYVASNAVLGVPAFKPFAAILAPAVNSLTAYGVTALSTAAFTTPDQKK
jgi:hypothetical protein